MKQRTNRERANTIIEEAKSSRNEEVIRFAIVLLGTPNKESVPVTDSVSSYSYLGSHLRFAPSRKSGTPGGGYRLFVIGAPIKNTGEAREGKQNQPRRHSA